MIMGVTKMMMIGAIAAGSIAPNVATPSTTAIRIGVGQNVYSYGIDKNNRFSLFPTFFDPLTTYSTVDQTQILKKDALNLFSEQRSFTPEEREFYDEVNKRKMKKTGLNIFDLLKGKEDVS